MTAFKINIFNSKFCYQAKPSKNCVRWLWYYLYSSFSRDSSMWEKWFLDIPTWSNNPASWGLTARLWPAEHTRLQTPLSFLWPLDTDLRLTHRAHNTPSVIQKHVWKTLVRCDTVVFMLFETLQTEKPGENKLLDPRASGHHRRWNSVNVTFETYLSVGF